MNLTKQRVFALAVVFATLLSVQCSEKEGPIYPYLDTEPPPYVITWVSANPASVPPGEDFALWVAVSDRDHMAVEGVTVTFETDFGGLSSATATTDDQGLAGVVYLAPAATGVAGVTAGTEGASTTTCTIQVGQGALTVTPASILADGLATAAIEVTVVDGDGSPVSGAQVTFSTDVGSVRGASAFTDGDGYAEATLVSVASGVDLAGTVQAVVRYDSFNQTESAPCIMRGVSVSVEAEPAAMPADGVSIAAVTAWVRETTSGAPVPGAQVVFGSTLGAISGPVVTDDNGLATTYLVSSTTPGVATITALYGEIDETTQVTFGSLTLLLVAAEPKMAADGASSQTITATLLSESHNPVSGVEVDFTTNYGLVTGSAMTDGRGRASALLTAPTSLATAKVIASFKGVCKDTVQVSFQNPILSLRALPVVVTAKPGNSVSIVAYATFSDGSAVPNGTAVAFSTTQGFITASGLVQSGQATSQLRPNGAADDEVIVRATCGSASTTTQVMFVPDVAAEVACRALPDTISGGGTSFSLIEARITDTYGNPVGDGTLVTFSLQAGSGLVSPTGLTSAGVATARFSPTGGGVARVRATCDQAYADAGIVVLAQMAGAIIASPDTAWISVGEGADRGQAVITAHVFDSHMTPVDEGTEVTFRILGGPGGGEYLDQPGLGYGPVIKETSGGMASVTVNSGTKAGTLLMTITAGDHVSTAVKVGISAGLPDAIFVTTGEVVTGGDGIYIQAVSAIVRDKYNNPVENGTAVYFTLDRSDVGLINPETTTGGLFPCTELSAVANKGVTHACLEFPTSSMNKAYTINASCGDVEGQFPTAVPTVLPVRIGVEAVPGSISGATGGVVTVYMSLWDTYELPVENACVRFVVDGPGTIEPAFTATDSDGAAFAILTIPAGTEAGSTKVKVRVCMTDVEEEAEITITE
ncbi:MAG: invasin domain 3-containing protein [bacterium]